MPCTDHETDTGTQDSGISCGICAPAIGAPCEGCGVAIYGGSPCEDCVICDRCHETVPEDETTETVRGSTTCESCRDRWYWQCDECDGWNRDGRDCGNGCCGSDCDCRDCRGYDEDDDRGGRVFDYDYKPRPVFHGAGPLFLGPEIEIETPYDRDWECAEIARSYLGSLGYLKNDSSIANTGFEIVTHPMSYQWAIDHFPWQMLTRLNELGCAATDGTGLHVHVSRAGFASACHTYRWMKFIYRNERHVTALARRSSGQWAAFTDQDRRAVKDYTKGAYGSRYRAINTANTDTFELRVFASSLDPREVQAALGFAAASVEYTRHLTVRQITQDDGWGWKAFEAWLAGQPAYRPLVEGLEALSCAC